jgi:D-aminopeptidase
MSSESRPGVTERLDALFQPFNSNAAYTPLSPVVERIGGLSYDEFLRQRICAPLGLHDTRLLASDLESVASMATLHMPQKDGSWRRGIYPTDEFMGCGGMISTIDDMLGWLEHLHAPEKIVIRGLRFDRV